MSKPYDFTKKPEDFVRWETSWRLHRWGWSESAEGVIYKWIRSAECANGEIAFVLLDEEIVRPI